MLSAGVASQLPPSRNKEVVFCGRSNVGKSSLLNKLCRRKALAKVSATPGKTTTINFFSAGDGVDIVDLPGYGYAKRSKAEKQRWAALMDSYFSSGRNIALVMQLLDMRHKPTADDETMMAFLNEMHLPFIAVLTKKDKLNKTELLAQRAFFATELEMYRPLHIVEFTVKDNESAERLRDIISAVVD